MEEKVSPEVTVANLRLHWIAYVAITAFAFGFAAMPSKSFGQSSVTRFVDAGGHRLNMLIEGTGTPTVILESGLGEGLESWNRVEPEVAKFTRVIAYDRAGLGTSDPSPRPRTAQQVARELHTALRNAKIAPPYLLVGHSASGFTIRVFAAMYPKEIAGLVFVDPTQEGLVEWLKLNRPDTWKEIEEETAKSPEGVRKESAASETNERQARKARLPNVPTVLLAGARTNDSRTPQLLQFWMEKHRQFLRGLPKSKFVLAEKSGHFIQRDQPELVVEAIKDVINLKRAP